MLVFRNLYNRHSLPVFLLPSRPSRLTRAPPPSASIFFSCRAVTTHCWSRWKASPPSAEAMASAAPSTARAAPSATTVPPRTGNRCAPPPMSRFDAGRQATAGTSVPLFQGMGTQVAASAWPGGARGNAVPLGSRTARVVPGARTRRRIWSIRVSPGRSPTQPPARSPSRSGFRRA